MLLPSLVSGAGGRMGSLNLVSDPGKAEVTELHPTSSPGFGHPDPGCFRH